MPPPVDHFFMAGSVPEWTPPPPSRPVILDLADDTLLQIFKIVHDTITEDLDTIDPEPEKCDIHGRSASVRKTDSQFAPLTLICRRFNSTTTAQLYRNLAATNFTVDVHSAFPNPNLDHQGSKGR